MKKAVLGLVLVSLFGLVSGCSTNESSKKEESAKTETSSTVKEKDKKEATELKSKRGTIIPATIVMPQDNTKEKMPLVVLAHGFMGSRDEAGGFSEVADNLAKNGVASIRIDFPGCNESKEKTTEYSMKNNTDDVLSAIEFMKETYNIDADKVGMLGYSMGGRITSLVSKETPLNTIVLWAPLISKNWEGTLEGKVLDDKISEAKEKGHSTIEFFGNDIEVSQALLEDLNTDESVKDIDAYKGNALLITGGKDKVVLKSVTDNVQNSLKNAAKSETVLLENVGHGMGIYEKDRESQDKLVKSSIDFFTQNLK
ncbi:alpha/beta hydrolase family protein [Vagococcus silagei]|nr:alpha/beta fold hydrolase [Vagococcus silagei]